MLADGSTTSVEIVESWHQRHIETEKDLHAYLSLHAEHARRDAREADARRQNGDRSPLLGLPVAIKDNICVKDMTCTCGSRILHTYRPPYDATVISKLKESGAIIVGKTNMDEFAMGSSTENSAFGPSKNPWDVTRVPGGSSGGSAVAVAAGLASLSLGSDTGGSIRQPAAHTGVCGMKPTYGRVSRYGLVAYASSLDQIGPFAHDVEDIALALQSIAGYDPMDSTSAPVEVPDYKAFLDKGVKGLKFGLPKEYFGDGLSPHVRSAVTAAIKILEQQGAHIVEVSLPNIGYALNAYYIIAPAEASSNLARYDGSRYGLRVKSDDVTGMFKKTREQGFGPEVKRRIMIGTYALSAGYYDAYYLKAQQVRTLIKRDFDRAFEQCNALLCPATPSTAFRFGEKTDDPLAMYLEDIYTVAVNLAGLPGLVVPCGFHEGLPIGLQILSPAFTEGLQLQIGAEYQRHTQHHGRRPEVNQTVPDF